MTTKKGLKEVEGNVKMKLSIVEMLSDLFARKDFKYGKCSQAARIKIVRLQIVLDPISQTVKDAREKAEKAFMSERLKALLPKAMNGRLSEEEGAEFEELYPSYEKSFIGATKPTLDKEVAMKLEKLTLKEFNEIFESNSDWMTGNTPKLIFTNLVDDKPVSVPDECVEV